MFKVVDIPSERSPLPSGSPLMVSQQDGSHTGEMVLCWA